MNHTWKPNKDFVKDCDFLSEDNCAVCGCRRHKVGMGKRRTAYMYNRSGMSYGFERPDCLDWDDNTLDTEVIMEYTANIK